MFILRRRLRGLGALIVSRLIASGCGDRFVCGARKGKGKGIADVAVRYEVAVVN